MGPLAEDHGNSYEHIMGMRMPPNDDDSFSQLVQNFHKKRLTG